MQIKTILFFVILVSFSWSKTGQEVEVPINVGVGPALFWIPGVVDRELHTGAQLKLYAVLTPKILQENKDKIPKKYRKYVNMDEEMHISPIWLALIPEYLVISPGEENSIYGGLWSLFSISMNIWKTQKIRLDGKLTLPTITYLYAYEKNEPDTQHILGAGAILKLENTIQFSENFLTTLAYGHNFNIALNTGEQWFHAGVLSLVFHFRFNSMHKI
ncbi:MAG: hypothetical protein LBB36_01855 [Fibromonadaceae bacterium]|jgi:hypothetical protein|nr:hypothetical protein [Fibromonadaceae bacterium]